MEAARVTRGGFAASGGDEVRLEGCLADMEGRKADTEGNSPVGRGASKTRFVNRGRSGRVGTASAGGLGADGSPSAGSTSGGAVDNADNVDSGGSGMSVGCSSSASTGGDVCPGACASAGASSAAPATSSGGSEIEAPDGHELTARLRVMLRVMLRVTLARRPARTSLIGVRRFICDSSVAITTALDDVRYIAYVARTLPHARKMLARTCRSHFTFTLCAAQAPTQKPNARTDVRCLGSRVVTGEVLRSSERRDGASRSSR